MGKSLFFLGGGVSSSYLTYFRVVACYWCWDLTCEKNLTCFLGTVSCIHAFKLLIFFLSIIRVLSVFSMHPGFQLILSLPSSPCLYPCLKSFPSARILSSIFTSNVFYHHPATWFSPSHGLYSGFQAPKNILIWTHMCENQKPGSVYEWEHALFLTLAWG